MQLLSKRRIFSPICFSKKQDWGPGNPEYDEWLRSLPNEVRDSVQVMEQHRDTKGLRPLTKEEEQNLLLSIIERQEKEKERESVTRKYRSVLKDIAETKKSLGISPDDTKKRKQIHDELEKLDSDRKEKLTEVCPACNLRSSKEDMISLDGKSLCYECAENVVEKKLYEIQTRGSFIPGR